MERAVPARPFRTRSDNQSVKPLPLPLPLPLPPPTAARVPNRDRKRRVAIVGSGVTGLGAAYHLVTCAEGRSVDRVAG